MQLIKWQNSWSKKLMTNFGKTQCIKILIFMNINLGL